MATSQDGSEVVIRFSPFLPERLKLNAEDTYQDELESHVPQPRYGVSVLASLPERGEDIEATVRRILSSTTLNGKKVAVMTGNELRTAGFEIVADPNAKEPLHHLVGENPFTDVPRVDALASLMKDRVSNPFWKEGSR